MIRDMPRAFAPVCTVCMLLILGAGCAENGVDSQTIDWVEISADTYLLGSREDGAAQSPRDVKLSAFHISSREIGVGVYCQYLNDSNLSPEYEHPQIQVCDDCFSPRSDKKCEPVAFVSYSDALGFCEWYGRVVDAVVRLPSGDEWEAAARGGVRGGRYPWGWGSPVGRANYGSSAICESGNYDPNPIGIYDMAGNLFEWCSTSNTNGKAPVRGGSWAEDDVRFLRVYHEVLIDKEYRDEDVGFRIVRE